MTATGKARKREQAIAVLLESPTVTEAAQVVGVGEKTLRRWVADYTGSDGKRVQKFFTTKEQAEDHFADAIPRLSAADECRIC